MVRRDEKKEVNLFEKDSLGSYNRRDHVGEEMYLGES
jgi:hypothetical protein